MIKQLVKDDYFPCARSDASIIAECVAWWAETPCDDLQDPKIGDDHACNAAVYCLDQDPASQQGP